MRGLLKKALTRKIARKGSRGKEQIIVISPSERLVVGVKFAVGMIGCLSAIEIAYIWLFWDHGAAKFLHVFRV